MLVLGYTLFAAALFLRVWMLLLALRWEKVTDYRLSLSMITGLQPTRPQG